MPPRDSRTNTALPRTLRQLADLEDIRGDRTQAVILRRAAGVIEAAGPGGAADVARRVRGGKLDRLTGIHPTAAIRVQAIITSGAPAVLSTAAQTIPRDLRRLIEMTGLGTSQVADIHGKLGVTTATEFDAALNDGRLTDPELFDYPVQPVLRRALLSLRAGETHIPLGRATRIVKRLIESLEAVGIGECKFHPTGSLRRFEPTVGDIAILCVAADPNRVIDAIVALPSVKQVLHRSKLKTSVRIDDYEVDVRFVADEELPFALLHSTGSPQHNRLLRRRAGDRDLLLSSSNIIEVATRTERPCRSEEEIYAVLDLQYIPPELRHGEDEVEKAATGAMPTLVSRSDIRGDLHMHSTWSDGRDSIEAMVHTARALGYEYLAIADHSEHAAAPRTLAADHVGEQKAEIERLRKSIPDITILHGIEVDILPDGSLDFSNTVLEQFDLVLASLHEGAGQSRRELTDRYRAAMKNPLVNIITHPTNRIIGHDDGYELDFDVLFETAVATGTVMEIDGSPVHLDMDGATTRRAVAAGVTLSINSDAHRASRLDEFMRFGIATARRGWAEPRHVLNCRPLAEVLKILRKKQLG